MQGKKQALRVESLAALEKTIGHVLDILGLMPASYSMVQKLIPNCLPLLREINVLPFQFPHFHDFESLLKVIELHNAMLL